MSGSGWARELTRNRKVDAALNNEALTRERVDRLERRVRMIDSVLEAMESRSGFWGRLRWLVRGR